MQSVDRRAQIMLDILASAQKSKFLGIGEIDGFLA